MAERIGDRMNAGMRALGSAVGKSLGQGLGQVTQVQTAANVESAKVAEALQEVARAIDRLAEAVRSLRNQPGETLR
jgi:hypothetical protein